MKNAIAIALLLLAAWTAQAQPVSVSTRVIEFPPTWSPGQSADETVIFSNNTSQPILVHNLYMDEPFEGYWSCGSDEYLQAQSTCRVGARHVARVGEPLGLSEGLLTFDLATGAIQVRLRGFAVTRDPAAGMQNLMDSVHTLEFGAHVAMRLVSLITPAEHLLLDGRLQNDRAVCALMGTVVKVVENEAAIDRVSEWSALAIIVQAEAVASAIGCVGVAT